MKYEVKKLSDYDIAMIGSIYPLTELDMMGVMMDKGDIELPNINKPPIIVTIGEEFDDSFELPKGKPMKAAERRKRTYHKHQQRERQYRNLGYHLDRFSKADLGKMKEGVGMFPETQHQYTLYNRGEKKGEKPITTKQAISMMEHEKWLDEQEAIAEYEKAEWLMVAGDVAEMKQEVCRVNDELEYCNCRLSQMMESLKELNDSINHMRQRKERLIENIMKEEEWLEAHKK
jgi:hypothetical protein